MCCYTFCYTFRLNAHKVIRAKLLETKRKINIGKIRQNPSLSAITCCPFASLSNLAFTHCLLQDLTQSLFQNEPCYADGKAWQGHRFLLWSISRKGNRAGAVKVSLALCRQQSFYSQIKVYEHPVRRLRGLAGAQEALYASPFCCSTTAFSEVALTRMILRINAARNRAVIMRMMVGAGALSRKKLK